MLATNRITTPLQITEDAEGELGKVSIGRCSGSMVIRAEDSNGSIDLCGGGISINEKQVLADQQPAIPNATPGTELQTVNAILETLRAHGLSAPPTV